MAAVEHDVSSAALGILNGNVNLSDWNSTLFTLILKVPKPTSPKDFRPISLCNICYKIVSRAITNRLKPIMSAVINHNQSAFVPGRLITDNVIVAYECMHWIRSNTKNRNGFGALKLDMSKAFDRVEWIFLVKIMTKMGFAETSVNLILRCISSVSYSIRINNSIFGTITPQRGIRQGDPLSPFLFAICSQGLSALLLKAEADNRFKGVKIANSCPPISLTCSLEMIV